MEGKPTRATGQAGLLVAHDDVGWRANQPGLVAFAWGFASGSLLGPLALGSAVAGFFVGRDRKGPDRVAHRGGWLGRGMRDKNGVCRRTHGLIEMSELNRCADHRAVRGRDVDRTARGGCRRRALVVSTHPGRYTEFGVTTARASRSGAGAGCPACSASSRPLARVWHCWFCC